MNDDVLIRSAVISDKPAIWSILEPIVGSGLYYYGFSTKLSQEQMMGFWFSATHENFVAEFRGVVVGAYFIRPNPHAGPDVANGAYGTLQEFQGRGIGQAMCDHSLERARQRGFKAMEFFQVISTNVRAVSLWERNGFQIVGRAPELFSHPYIGSTEMYIMRRNLL